MSLRRSTPCFPGCRSASTCLKCRRSCPSVHSCGRFTTIKWRTPPLWGVGLIPQVNGHQLLLHDGRARGVLEAILWHGGEADPSRRQVLRMSPGERRALVAFVNSL